MSKGQSVPVMLSIIVLFLVFSTVTVGANEGDTYAEAKRALGFNAGFGGTGISYRNYFSSEDGIQLTGSINTYGSDINFNAGFLYRRVLHKRDRTRLLITPGFSFDQHNQHLGSALEVELNPDWMENVSSSISVGYQLTSSREISIGPMMSVSLFYNF
ncbi:MAG: hypothetical protein ACOC1N_05685 [Bacillota bacterium]